MNTPEHQQLMAKKYNMPDTRNNFEPIIRVGSNVIVIQDNKVLLGKRLNAAGAGFYGVPGGHLEFGESLVAAAKRELLEETGLIAEDIEFVTVINQPRTASQQHYIQFVFICKKFHGQLQNLEHDKCEGWEWFDLEELPENIFLAHKEFIPAYLAKKFLID